ncbi:MAG: glutathione S-transferase family protein [Alphaproteobacteria bacterium]|nr:glutathione S-transferase family protein [Alphaproteobacteria bacterium]
MLNILGRANSINVRKVLWLCDELGIEYTREDWGQGFRDTKDPAYLALNPNGLVPVIRDGDFVLWESDAIVRYLAQREGRGDLYPEGLRERATVEQWMNWYGTNFSQSFRYAFHGLIRKNPAFADPGRIDESLRACAGRVAILDAHLAASGPYVAGADFTLADILMGAGVNRWMHMPADKPPCPAVAAYYTRLSERPAYARWFNADNA